MEKCRETCAIYIALEARRKALQDSKDPILEASSQAVDRLGDLEHQAPAEDQHPIDAARQSGNQAIIRSNEVVLGNIDWEINLIDQQLAAAEQRCSHEPAYLDDLTRGGLVLRCSGFGPGFASVLLGLGNDAAA